MGCQQDVRRTPEWATFLQGFVAKDIQASTRKVARMQCRGDRSLVNDPTARKHHQVGPWTHRVDMPRVIEAARLRGNRNGDRDHVRLRHEGRQPIHPQHAVHK